MENYNDFFCIRGILHKTKKIIPLKLPKRHRINTPGILRIMWEEMRHLLAIHQWEVIVWISMEKDFLKSFL